MATFIPPWHRESARDARIKSALNALSDEYVVRRPLPPMQCSADLFIQHRTRGWLALAVLHITFSELQEAQLFSPQQRAQFEQRLVQLRSLELAAPGLESLIVMWACTTHEVSILSQYHGDAALVSRDQFSSQAVQLIDRLCNPLPAGSEQHLLATYFPEAEIPAICTTRRFFARDNSATLQRFFLDSEQEWAVKLDLEPTAEQRELAGDFSVRLINGVAGSGKTLIAIHRALLLARLFPGQSILLLIHNTPIVADVLDRLQRVHGALPRNVEILTFFAWAHRQWSLAFEAQPRMPEDRQKVRDLVRHHRMRWPGLTLDDGQLIEELDFINDLLLQDEAAYLAASRTGRGFSLRETERGHVWALHVAVAQALNATGLRLWSALPREICLAQHRHHALQRYQHILVDEAQFFAPSWLQLVRLALAGSGQLFLCADPNQGFMKNRLSWKRAGLTVVGRTKKLRRSYRTTKAILETASAVLAVLGREDGEDYLEPLYDDMEPGERPVLLHADTPQDALDRLVNELATLIEERGIPLGAFLVVYGENVNRQALYAQLCRRLGRDNVWWFNERDQKKRPPLGHGREYLRMAYADTATGLEASLVFLIGMEPLFTYELLAAPADEGQRERLETNARKLYMAMTRAGQQLFVVSSQRLPAGMQSLFGKA